MLAVELDDHIAAPGGGLRPAGLELSAMSPMSVRASKLTARDTGAYSD